MAEILNRTYTYAGQSSLKAGKCSLPLSSFTVSGDTRPITQVLSISVRYHRWQDTSSVVGHTASLVFANGAETIVSSKSTKRGDQEYFWIANTFSEMPSAADFTASNVTLTTQMDTKTNYVYWHATASYPITLTITYYSSEFKPGISGLKLYRAGSIGEARDSGTYLTFQAKLSVESAGTSGSGTLQLYDVDSASVIFTKSGIAGSTNGVVVTQAPLSGYTLAIGSAGYYKAVFSYTAQTSTGAISTETIESAAIYVDRVFTNFHLAGVPTGGACFGGFSTAAANNPKLESHYPGYFYAGIEGVTNYSGGEADTGGKWIDGKSIYRFVAVGTSALDGTQGVFATLPSMPETMLSLRAMVGVDGGWRPVPNNYFGNSAWNCNIYSSGAEITLGFGSSWNTERTVIVIAEYTKEG